MNCQFYPFSPMSVSFLSVTCYCFKTNVRLSHSYSGVNWSLPSSGLVESCTFLLVKHCLCCKLIDVVAFCQKTWHDAQSVQETEKHERIVQSHPLFWSHLLFYFIFYFHNCIAPAPLKKKKQPLYSLWTHNLSSKLKLPVPLMCQASWQTACPSPFSSV